MLDETFGEDKSTIKLGKQGDIPDIIDDVCDNLEIGFQMILRSIPSRY